MTTKKKLRRQLAEVRRERDELTRMLAQCDDQIGMYRFDIRKIAEDIGRLNDYCVLCNRIIQAEVEIERRDYNDTSDN